MDSLLAVGSAAAFGGWTLVANATTFLGAPFAWAARALPLCLILGLAVALVARPELVEPVRVHPDALEAQHRARVRRGRGLRQVPRVPERDRVRTRPGAEGDGQRRQRHDERRHRRTDSDAH